MACVGWAVCKQNLMFRDGQNQSFGKDLNQAEQQLRTEVSKKQQSTWSSSSTLSGMQYKLHG